MEKLFENCNTATVQQNCNKLEVAELFIGIN